MSGRPKQRSHKYRARRLINSEQFWDLVFDLIRNGQNLPAISKAVDVPYRTLWGWINESDENRQRYNKLKEEQDEMIRVKIDEFINSMMQGDIQVETEITKNGLIQYRIRINICEKTRRQNAFLEQIKF